MISHEHKCIFIHIPKCAGTSIEQALGHLDDHHGRDCQDHRSIRMIQRPLVSANLFSSVENGLEVLRRLNVRMRTAANPRNKLTVTRVQFESYFKFAFVRNPWARAYSWYQNVMRDDVHKARYKITDDVSLHAFLRRYAGRRMLKPQTYWLKDFSGAIPLDFIGRFETLDNDFQRICESIGVPRIALPHRIKGSGEDYRERYEQASKKLIAEVYREEIEMFGYSFDDAHSSSPVAGPV